jgi:hypothetical protein
MSLVGSLEDLGLGDILQIITLSRKSGSLNLRSRSGEGRVIFRDGLVCGARVKGRTPDVRGLVVVPGALGADEFESLRGDAAGRGASLALALADRLGGERFERMRRECVERAVLDMFGWDTGEFSFEVGDDAPEDEFEVMLDTGINAQYLAMEGTRRTDEEGRPPAADPGDESSFADLAEEMAADESSRPSDAYEAVALTTVEKVGGEPEEAEGEDEVAAAFEAAMLAEPEDQAAASAPRAAGRKQAEPGQRPPVVVLDAALPVLEWVKGVLEGTFRRVHIFQKPDLAVERLRQYMRRGDSPLLLVSPTLAIARGQGLRDVDELVKRTKKQSPRSPVLWLGSREQAAPADGAVPCPGLHEVTGRGGPDEAQAAALRDGLLAALGEAPDPDVPPPAARPEGKTRAKAEAKPARPPAAASSAQADRSERVSAVIARMLDPETRGEILNVALAFAAEHFQRVALLAVRGGEALGLAGIGLERAGGPTDEALRGVKVRVGEARWLSRVVDARRAARAPAEGGGDHELAARLGEVVASEAWVGPVISGGQVVAVIYGDNLPGRDPLADTEELETVLAQAGLALERVAEERARAG